MFMDIKSAAGVELIIRNNRAVIKNYNLVFWTGQRFWLKENKSNVHVVKLYLAGRKLLIRWLKLSSLRFIKKSRDMNIFLACGTSLWYVMIVGLYIHIITCFCLPGMKAQHFWIMFVVKVSKLCHWHAFVVCVIFEHFKRHIFFKANEHFFSNMYVSFLHHSKI